jgi:hypothetical protein
MEGTVVSPAPTPASNTLTMHYFLSSKASSVRKKLRLIWVYVQIRKEKLSCCGIITGSLDCSQVPMPLVENARSFQREAENLSQFLSRWHSLGFEQNLSPSDRVTDGGGKSKMEKKEKKTAHNEPGQAWAMVWNELKRAGIRPGEKGPIEGTIHWGENAEVAIQMLKESKLPASDVDNFGLLLQAALHAAEIYWRPDDLAGGRQRKRISRKD